MIGYLTGLLVLVHAAYSSYEHHSLTFGTAAVYSIPTDIILETVIGIIIIGYAAIQLVSNDMKLSIDGKLIKPEYAYLKPIEMKHAVKELELLGVSDYSKLDNRLDFIDIKAKRNQFQSWLDSN